MADTDGTTTGDDVNTTYTVTQDDGSEFEFVPAEEADSGMVAGGEGSLKTWEYRVVSITREDPLGHPEQSYELIEAYYRNRDDTDIVMWASPEDTRPHGDTLLDLRADLERMLAACDKPVLIEEELPDA